MAHERRDRGRTVRCIPTTARSGLPDRRPTRWCRRSARPTLPQSRSTAAEGAHVSADGHQGDCRAVVGYHFRRQAAPHVTSPADTGLRDYGCRADRAAPTPPEYVAADGPSATCRAQQRRRHASMNIGDSHNSATKGNGGATSRPRMRVFFSATLQRWRRQRERPSASAGLGSPCARTAGICALTSSGTTKPDAESARPPDQGARVCVSG